MPVNEKTDDQSNAEGRQAAAADPVLRQGDVGAAVVTLQKLLNENGANLVADGEFGPATKAAVVKFQQQNGLVADGIVGADTWVALRKPKTLVYQVMPIYAYYLESPWRFRYSANSSVEGWKKSGVGFFAFGKDQAGTVPVYQYSAANPARYHYSTNPNVGQGWVNDGVAFYAFKKQEANTIPVYQYAATNPMRYQYSTNPDGGPGWVSEGAAFYVFAAKPV
ncbi:MAG TPA: peptidoglycan-binding domain-containing protein [Coleofasciculaceae cyanobacterium]